MLQTKFHENQPAGSGEDFEGFLPYMGMSAILVMCPESTNFHFLVPESFHTKFGSEWHSSF